MLLLVAVIERLKRGLCERSDTLGAGFVIAALDDSTDLRLLKKQIDNLNEAVA